MSSSELFGPHLNVTYEDDHVWCQLDQMHCSGGGALHGGFTAALVDMAMGNAVSKVLADGQRAVTVQLSVSFANPGWPGDILVARGSVSRHGRSVILTTAKVTNQDGDLIAEALGTFNVVSK